LVTPYPVCSMTWGQSGAEVSLLDLVAMARYAYSANETEFEGLLKQSFKNAKNIHFDPFEKLPRVVASRICGSDGTTKNCTIIMAVKGTSNKLEVMTDLGIFSTVGIMQGLDIMAPLLGTVPRGVISFIIGFFRLPFLQSIQQNFTDTLEKKVKQFQEEHTDDSVVITGHSLGGNFAEIVGARLGIPAVGFSAPGQYYMMSSFDIGKQNIFENVVTIIPRMDPVPHVAKHVDVAQSILCRKKNGKYRANCHSIEATACELWRVCGDVKNRSFAKQCLDDNDELGREAFVNGNCVGQEFSSDEDASCKMAPEL